MEITDCKSRFNSIWTIKISFLAKTTHVFAQKRYERIHIKELTDLSGKNADILVFNFCLNFLSMIQLTASILIKSY